MTEEGAAARLVRNTLTNGVGAVIGVVVFLVLTPFMILQLGAEAYGVFTLALSLSFLGGYAAFTDLGLEAATARYVAEARSDGDDEQVNRLASTTMAFFGVAAIVLAPVIALAAFPLVKLFGVSPELHTAAVVCFAFTGVQLLFELPARTYFAVLEGSQRFIAFQACQIVRIITQATLFIVALVFHLGIGALGGALAASSLVVLLLAHRIAHRAVGTLHLAPHLASRPLLKTLLGYGGAIVGMRLLDTLYRQMDRVILGIVLGPRYVTVFEVANKIQASAQLVQSIAASALVPAAAYARARAEILQDMFLRGTALTLAASLPVAGAVFIFAEPLIRTWISPSYVEAATPTRLFTGYLIGTSVLTVGTTMTVALGHVRFILTVNAVVVGANLIVSLLLVRPLGVDGVVLASVLTYWAAFPIQLRFFMAQFQTPLSLFARRVLVPQLPGLVVQVATAVPLLWVAQRAHNLVEVGLLAILSILLSLAAFVLIGLSREQRTALVKTVREAAGQANGTPSADGGYS